MALEQDREQQILDWIKQNAEGSTPVTRKEIREYCTSQFQVPITRSDHSSKNFPQEEQGLQVPRMFLKRTMQNLSEYVQGWTPELVFNLDEIDISDWEDRKARKVVGPGTMRGQTRHATSPNISKGEAYLGDCLCLRSWRIAHR
jgi:hypothetical protein